MAPSGFSLHGKTIVVLGGTSGIGRTLALGLAEAGADVVASGRRPQQIAETAAETESRGRSTIRLASDVRNRTSLEALRDAAIAAFGEVDVLVNSAGITAKNPTIGFREETWAEIPDTNLTSTLRGCQVFGQRCQ
jgi:NAD(P)-dependent dehydrogenase (short-subunit alcohol dehydrogenase family)